MSTWIYVLIAVLVLLLFFYIVYKRNSGIPVLKTRIGTNDGNNYPVYFEKLNPETKDIEYVRMVLNFTAKNLYLIDARNDFVRYEILDFILKVSETDLNPEAVDILLPQSFTVEYGDPNGKVLEGVLYAKGFYRNIQTRIPITWFDHQLSYTIFALIKITVQHVDSFHRSYLKDSLIYMAKSYMNGRSPKDFKNMFSIPNEAFLARNVK